MSPSQLIGGVLFLWAGWYASVAAAPIPDPKSGVIPCTKKLTDAHNPEQIANASDLICFEGYLSKFEIWPDGDPRTDKGAWGIPQWTIHRVEGLKAGEKVAEGRTRPSSWFTVPELQDKGLAPTDTDYRFSRRFRDRHSNWYERGHLTQKYLAERLPPTAGWFTHNVVNAVPQLARFNKGPWLTLECFTGAWANENRRVWIISGPVFLSERPAAWLKSDSARAPFPIAIPDAIFKIVARKGDDGSWDALAFLYPQDHPSYKKGPWSPSTWLTSIQRIEKLTGETFSPALQPAGGRRDRPGRLWPVQRTSFDPSCKRFAVEVP